MAHKFMGPVRIAVKCRKSFSFVAAISQTICSTKREHAVTPFKSQRATLIEKMKVFSNLQPKLYFFEFFTNPFDLYCRKTDGWMVNENII